MSNVSHTWERAGLAGQSYPYSCIPVECGVSGRGFRLFPIQITVEGHAAQYGTYVQFTVRSTAS